MFLQDSMKLERLMELAGQKIHHYHMLVNNLQSTDWVPVAEVDQGRLPLLTVSWSPLDWLILGPPIVRYLSLRPKHKIIRSEYEYNQLMSQKHEYARTPWHWICIYSESNILNYTRCESMHLQDSLLAVLIHQTVIQQHRKQTYEQWQGNMFQ